MKKLIPCLALAFALVASAVYASRTNVWIQTQVGNGTNGMTYVPDAGEGAVIVANNAGLPSITYARVSIRSTAAAGALFQNAANISYLRCYHYAQDPNSPLGTFTEKQCGAFDIAVDGGPASGGAAGQHFGSAMEFIVGPLPYSQPGEAYTWACENCQQATTLDAGVGVAVELFMPPLYVGQGATY